MDEPWKHDAKGKKAGAKGHNDRVPLAGNRTNMANSERRKVGCWLPVPGRGDMGCTVTVHGRRCAFVVTKLLKLTVEMFHCEYPCTKNS